MPLSPARASEVAPLLRRLARYQAERFPLAAYGPMVAVASVAAIGWSRSSRGAAGFVTASHAGTAAITMLVAFALLRVADEHKDAPTDRVARPELPVPRGLVTLGELRLATTSLVLVVLALNALLLPRALAPLALVAAWTALMTREFFAREWLRAHATAYLASHMAVMPLILLYGTSVDWLVAGAPPPRGLAVFLAASYASGLVLEVGRKLREPAAERPAVETYTSLWGHRTALAVWGGALVAASVAIGTAMRLAGSSTALAVIVPLLLAVFTGWGAIGVRAGIAGAGKRIETRSALFTLGAYAALALPWLLREYAR